MNFKLIDIVENLTLGICQDKKSLRIISIITILYCGFLPDIIFPKIINDIFENNIVNTIILMIIFYKSSKCPNLGILISLMYTFTLRKVNRNKIKNRINDEMIIIRTLL